MAGTQLCCVLDPPRQAEGLRMAYRVRYPNLPILHLSFLTSFFSGLYIITSKEILKNPKEGSLRTRHRIRKQRVPWILEAQDASKMPPRWPKMPPRCSQDPSKTSPDAPKTAQDGPRHPQDAPKTPQDSQKCHQKHAKIKNFH